MHDVNGKANAQVQWQHHWQPGQSQTAHTATKTAQADTNTSINSTSYSLTANPDSAKHQWQQCGQTGQSQTAHTHTATMAAQAAMSIELAAQATA